MKPMILEEDKVANSEASIMALVYSNVENIVASNHYCFGLMRAL